jgi:hypothetical protein
MDKMSFLYESFTLFSEDFAKMPIAAFKQQHGDRKGFVRLYAATWKYWNQILQNPKTIIEQFHSRVSRKFTKNLGMPFSLQLQARRS